MKIVINNCCGEFGLSERAVKLLKRIGLSVDDINGLRDDRTNEALVKVVEKLGDAASSNDSELIVTEIEDDSEWMLENHHGKEWVVQI